MHHPFGLAGGAGGEYNFGHVIGVRLRHIQCRVRRCHERIPCDLFWRSDLPDHHHMLQVRQLGPHASRHRAIIMAPEFVGNHQQPSIRQLEHMRQLTVAAAGCDQAADDADARCRQMQNQELFPVRQLQRHHIACTQSQRVQACRTANSLQRQFTIRDGPTAINNGRFVWRYGHGLIKKICQQPIEPCAAGGMALNLFRC